MAFDSKKTILLEKTYLYVRASLGFQLEGTSTEKIPTNNGFYRFFVDNLQKAIGNSYVNILYDSQDLTLQCFCSDLYMDELMSSDSSAIEDVVEELKKNNSTILEFENGVSSAFESNHQDNVALNAKLEEFESGVSSAMASNHEDNVAVQTTIVSKFDNFFNFFPSEIPCVSLCGYKDYVVIDSFLFSKFKKFIHNTVTQPYESSVVCSSWFDVLYSHITNTGGSNTSYGFNFNLVYPFNGSIPYNVCAIGLLDYLNSTRSFIELRPNLKNNVFSFGDSFDFPSYSLKTRPSRVLLSCTLGWSTLQILSSLCAFDFPSQNWKIVNTPISSDSSVISSLHCNLKKVNDFIPTDLSFHSFSDSFKGYLYFSIMGCDENDLDFIKKCDIYFYSSAGELKIVHLYSCSPYLVNGNIVFSTTPKYEFEGQNSFLSSMRLVYTGVSSAPSP